MKQTLFLALLLTAVVARTLAQDLVFSYAERREKGYYIADNYQFRKAGLWVVAFTPLSVGLWIGNRAKQPDLDVVQRMHGLPNNPAFMNFDPADSIVFAVERLAKAANNRV
jgi:hypothetical protein